MYYLTNTALRSLLFICIFIFSATTYAENPDTTMNKISKMNKYIASASKKMDIDPNCLKAVIYTERTMNYDWEDDVFDEVIASMGLTVPWDSAR
jgi:hypothetical protein